ncbi:unnamed protein product [Boreogadus saida]
MDFVAKQGHEYTQNCREFALTLHLHGPKAYKYLRETRNFPLPHPQTLQRWLRSVDAKPGLNKMMLDMLERRCQGDPTKYGCSARITWSYYLTPIRASGGCNNNPTACQFQAIFRRLMVRCGVSPSETGNVAAQDNCVSLSAVEMSSAETAEEHPSPFANISALVSDHSYLPTRFGGLVENALVLHSRICSQADSTKAVSCAVCRWSLVRDAVPSSFDKNFHLLTLKNNGGLVIPSLGTVKVLRAAERVDPPSFNNAS